MASFNELSWSPGKPPGCCIGLRSKRYPPCEINLHERNQSWDSNSNHELQSWIWIIHDRLSIWRRHHHHFLLHRGRSRIRIRQRNRKQQRNRWSHFWSSLYILVVGDMHICFSRSTRKPSLLIGPVSVCAGFSAYSLRRDSFFKDSWEECTSAMFCCCVWLSTAGHKLMYAILQRHVPLVFLLRCNKSFCLFQNSCIHVSQWVVETLERSGSLMLCSRNLCDCSAWKEFLTAWQMLHTNNPIFSGSVYINF